MSTLLESDFLTVNLKSILKNNNSTAAQAKNDTQKTDLRKISDWGKELAARRAANNKLDSESRKSENELEQEFFTDYFKNGFPGWTSACAKQLLNLGEPLRKALKVLGFNKNTNPILGFITNTYVIKNLILTRLLNAGTFKAIYSAVAKNAVADTEFFEVNDYNIIWCQDLYKKPVNDIIKYLNIQANILKPSSSSYSADDQKTNKKIFFYISSINEESAKDRKAAIDALPENTTLPAANDSNTVLNSLDLIKLLTNSNNTEETSDNENNTNDKQYASLNALMAKLGRGQDIAKSFAAIQYLSVTTGLPDATNALKDERFNTLSVKEIAEATAKVAPIMRDNRLQKDNIKSFIKILLDTLK